MPADPTALVGRTEELATLVAWLGARRLTTVTGPPGVGKTRLAQAAASRWPAGAEVLVCPLAHLRLATDLVAVVAERLAVRSDDGSLPFRADRVAAALGARDGLLLVLDNFEQLEPECARIVAAWASHPRGPAIVITSRHRLALPEEQVLRLTPLSADHATELFVRCAHRVRPDLALEPCAREQIATVVEACEGLPLALELAASRLSVLDLASLGARLGGARESPGRRSAAFAHELLHDVAGVREDRHGSLARAFAWSWELLDSGARGALVACAVFSGGFDLAAAEAVLPAGPGGVDGLQRLVDRSLVVARPDKDGMRFDLLAIVRELVLERAPDDERAAAERRHGDWFAALARGRAAHAGRVELDNLRAALERASQRPDTPPDDLAAMALAIAQHLTHEGRFRQAIAYLELARREGASPRAAFEVSLALGSALGASWQMAAARRELAAASALAGDDLEALARVALEVSRIHWSDSDFGAAWDHELAVLEPLARARPTPAVMAIRAGHALTRSLIGERAAAYRELEPLLRVARHVDDPAIAGLYEMAGLTAFMLGHVERAQAHYRAARAIAERYADHANEAWLRAFEATIRGSGGDLVGAEVGLDRALDALDRHGRAWHIGHVLHLAGDLRIRLERPAEAEALFTRAEGLARAMPHPKLLALLAQSRAIVAWRAGDLDVAARLGVEAQAHLGARRDPEMRAWIDMLRAVIEAARGRNPEARTLLTQATAALEGTGPSATNARAAIAAGALALARGERTEATLALRDALTPARMDGEVTARPPVFRLMWIWLFANELDRRLDADARRDAWANALDPHHAALVLDDDASRARAPGSPDWVDLRARPKVLALWRGLVAANGGRFKTVEDLLALAWPGETMRYEAGRNRVYAGLSELRRRGLEGVLARDGEGYTLAPRLAVVHIPRTLSELAPPTLPQE